MKKNSLVPAAAVGFTISGADPTRAPGVELEPRASRREIQESTTLIGGWLHLRMPDPRGGPGHELFMNLAKRVSYVCPGSATGHWRRRSRKE